MPVEPEDNLPFPPSDDELQAERRTSAIGRQGEELACRFLWRRGFRILTRNYRGPHGEIDVVAEKDGQLRFIEVKTRTSDSLGAPEERVDAEKRKRIRQTAQIYLGRFREAPPAGSQFDVVAQIVDGRGRAVEQNLIENAF
ncbi:YraN family protein [Candidatus Sumerlaeota bacterium]|nr:YraN family protein [Candidatus Sumerlaeota bacterium]